ncbi:MAG: hypothetical protein DI536_23115 [Archangium gephyra]|uniref:Uncharacterized protein n=1 Tax=Archangium gephyra TaxID=48 RepID=A0A2W5T9J5_9BACT|nr:MAG: hypothetical protein DI536_23115 [Archangium gephyra]
MVNLRDARHTRRLDDYRARLDRVIKGNRRAITRLFSTGMLFTKNGTRAGRDLLAAHEHLLRVVSLIERMGNEGDVPAPRKTEEIDAVFAEFDTLLDRTSELTEQTARHLEELRKD